ncbi:MAG: poly A polymerase [Bdellovibrio sp. ArHS]|uniref:CCA tRNA nucleotidyltransferase n=1 Tax=Bdellovibrio sp. ArHS TaxID=1569284 RepID=UPI000583CDC7|nr:CCA tRNA nucleotidyltransferase [Bdellovibrio sp. ArHS]KHD87904.1 MAG: poly A polymerase [Bdellovibrio sp. ArHS]
MSQVQLQLESHPHWPAVNAIYHKLQSAGYKAFLAGGCVRDALLGVPANDLDVATNATPDQIEVLFDKTVNVGKAFGVMRVLVAGADIEVATFRTDGDYGDGRRPDYVQFSSPQEDAQRRDFTVNALFYDLVAQKVLDFVEGEKDLRLRVIRTVGDAEKRFQEDHLRLLRAARFVAQLDFSLDSKTSAAIEKMAPLVKTVSGERLRDEMGKLLKSPAASKGLQIMQTTGLLQELFPFRLRDNSWVHNYEAKDAWQLLALFLRKAPREDLGRAIQLLRLSVKEQRAIQKAWELWQSPELFFKRRRGEQLQSLVEPGNLFALKVLLTEQKLAEEIQSLLNDWGAWNFTLPKPFLNGEDLLGKLSGKHIGLCLAEAFNEQLERQLESRDKALLWLQNYLQRNAKG